MGNTLGTFVGTAGTLTYTPTASGFPITPFVVGPVGEAGYQTIQSAITAANAAGGGLVFIQKGTYTENLTLFSGVDLLGSSNIDTTIVGVHTPPTSGSLSIQGLALSSATHILSSAAAGTTELLIYACFITATNGYLFNLLNWTGNLVVDTCGSNGANDGIVSNTAGALVKITNATMGGGTGNTCTMSGAIEFNDVDVQCPVNLVTGAVMTSSDCEYFRTLTLSNNSTFTSFGDYFNTGATPAITMSSSGNSSISMALISSSNNPAITGAGAGTLTLGDITFSSNSSTAGTLTLAYHSSRLGPTAVNGNLTFSNSGNKILSTSVATTTTAGANSFGSVTLVGGTATVSTTAVTANSLIYIWRQSIGATGAAALGQLTVGTIVAATSFVINAVQAANATALQATDVSVIGWMIVN